MLNNNSVVTKQEGENNTAIVNSKVDVVIVSAFDELARLKAKGDYNGIFQLIAQLGNMAETLHPFYPHYKYKMVNMGDRMIVDHEPRSKEDAELYPLSYHGEFNISYEDAKNFNNFDELLHDAYVNEREIEVDMVFLKALIGGVEVPTPVLGDAKGMGTWVIQPPPLPKPVELKLFAISNLKEIPILDSLELGIGGIDNEKQIITINNKKQSNCKLLVSLVLPLKGVNFEEEKSILSDTTLKVHIREGFEKNVEANKLLLQFLTLSKHDNLKIILKDVKNNRNFMSANGFNVDVEDMSSLESRLQLFERLYVIEQYYDVTFSIPEVVNLKEQDMIRTIECMMLNEPVKKTITSATATVSNRGFVHDLIKLFDNDENNYQRFKIETYGPNITINLFDAQIPLEKVEILYRELRVEDIPKLKRKYEDMEDGETIKIKLIPGPNKEIEEWYFAKL